MDQTQFIYHIYPSSEEIFLQCHLNALQLLSLNRFTGKITEVDQLALSQRVIYNTIGAHAILGLIPIENIDFLLYVKQYEFIGKIMGADIFLIKEVNLLPVIDLNTADSVPLETQKIVNGIKTLLSLGFYYSFNYDLTSTMQKQSKITKGKDRNIFEISDKKFFWNQHLYKKFMVNPTTPINKLFCVSLICGYVNMFIDIINNDNLDFILITRRSQYHVGTRYITRGIDDDGHCANYCESEQIVLYDGHIMSFNQIRGSAPIFFRQVGMTAQTEIIRSSKLTIQAFTKHLDEIIKDYSMMYFINLLNKTKPGEQVITEAMEEQIKLKSPNSILRYSFFDMQNECPYDNYDKIEVLIDKLQGVALIFQFYSENNCTGEIEKMQSGTIRTNCLDCLDRTNVIQTRISWMVFEKMLESINVPTLGIFQKGTFFGIANTSSGKLEEMFKSIWAENGDNISIQYAGTASTITTVTKTGGHGLLGFLQHGLVSVTRAYQGNIEDYFKQKCFDIFLQKHTMDLHITPSIENELLINKDEYTSYEDLNVFIGSWNVGGKELGQLDSLHDWLNHSNINQGKTPDIYIIGLQEIIDLNARNLMFGSTSNQPQYWENTISNHLAKIADYVKIKVIDLVGIFLIVFVKESRKEAINSLDTLIIKSGLMGSLGNKGSCMIRLNIFDSSIAIACSHLSAGKEYSEARRNEIVDILNRSFDKYPNRPYKDYEYFFLFGDLNSRIDLDTETCCSLINDKKYTELLMNDQFNGYRQETSVIREYITEADITFDPTYKYHVCSNKYDTTTRIPAYCDRILYKNGKIIIPLAYGRNEYMISDHRPIYGIYRITVGKINHSIRNQMIEELKIKQMNQENIGVQGNIKESSSSGKQIENINMHINENFFVQSQPQQGRDKKYDDINALNNNQQLNLTIEAPPKNPNNPYQSPNKKQGLMGNVWSMFNYK